MMPKVPKYGLCPAFLKIVLVFDLRVGVYRSLESWLLAVKYHIKTADTKITIGDCGQFSYSRLFFLILYITSSITLLLEVLLIKAWHQTKGWRYVSSIPSKTSSKKEVVFSLHCLKGYALTFSLRGPANEFLSFFRSATMKETSDLSVIQFN